MSPAREAVALDPGLAIAALHWIDRLDQAYGMTVARVAWRLTLYCASIGIDRIESSDRALVSILGLHRNDIGAAAHALEREWGIRTTMTGRVWRIPAGLLDLPAQTALPFPEHEDDEQPPPLLAAVENRRPQEASDRPQVHLLSNSRVQKTWPAQTANQQYTGSWPGNPGQLSVQKTRPAATEWLRPVSQRPQNQRVTDLWPGNPGQCPENQASPLSNSNSNEFRSANSQARSFGAPAPVDFSSPAHEIAAQIAALHTLAADQRQDGTRLASALHSYMEQFGDSHRDERRTLSALAQDEEILARCLGIASLALLLDHIRALGQADVRGMNSYGWFLTRFADKLRGIPKTVMKAALSKEKRSHRQTPKAPHDGGLAAANPQTNVNPSDEFRETVRTVAKSRSMSS